jgi:hypothetical protein
VGLLDVAGQRTVSALVQRIYSMDFINDKAGCFANDGIFPKNGRIIEFGSHRVYLGTVSERQYLSPVLEAPRPAKIFTNSRAAHRPRSRQRRGYDGRRRRRWRSGS